MEIVLKTMMKMTQHMKSFNKKIQSKLKNWMETYSWKIQYPKWKIQLIWDDRRIGELEKSTEITQSQAEREEKKNEENEQSLRPDQR